ncbi:hypothetical protein [Streptomyces sp. UNOC14_S4]|uniref:hypothetical protein n=1 Tax=Streptomyces sp. UNOC14_S4 TaxID=2872340 RepID=UPI001E411BFE|nr:hypothetical protein [Streptomyces sp. UNOC14_S4]MCC3766480.1 hypothetical protein [Streptomyces sp. UNOC14_S4]
MISPSELPQYSALFHLKPFADCFAVDLDSPGTGSCIGFVIQGSNNHWIARAKKGMELGTAATPERAMWLVIRHFVNTAPWLSEEALTRSQGKEN